MPSLRLGRTQTPCPTPTSCSSVAHGRATRPSLSMARAGVRETARRHRLTGFLTGMTGFSRLMMTPKKGCSATGRTRGITATALGTAEIPFVSATPRE
eukprot:scaffold117165_cov54-Phaeocystis_antarctica.AAC.1